MVSDTRAAMETYRRSKVGLHYMKEVSNIWKNIIGEGILNGKVGQNCIHVFF